MLYYNVGRPGYLGLPTQGVIGMKWFRSNIKHGSRLALFALAVQFALSFGHFHGIAAQAAPAVQSTARRFAANGCHADDQPSSSSRPITIPTSTGR